MTKRRTRKPNLSEEALARARAELRGEAAAGSASENSSTVTTAASIPAKVKTSTRAVATATRRIPTLEELQREYTYVIRDLRNLLVLSGVILAAIVVIAIVLPPVSG